MKKYILTLIILVSFGITSCDDELQIFPNDQQSSEVAFTGEGDFTNALRGMYRRMLGGTYYGGQLQGYDVMTDNLLISPEGRQSQQFRHDWAYDQNTGFAGFLSQTYAVVIAANFILENIDVLEDGDFKNNVIGQALTGRALAHFDAVRHFAKIPTQSSDAGSSLALPYITETDINNLPSRITVSEFYSNLVLDLTTASNLIGTNNGVYQMNKDATNGLLAKVYLHMGNWQGAVDAANKVTTPIAARSAFTGIWNDSSAPGCIFKLRNNNDLQEGVGIPYNQTAGGVKDEYVPDYAFYQQFDDTDIRKSAYLRTGVFAGNTYNHIVKWYSSVSTAFLGTVDAKVLRASEVMLTKAEALSNIPGQDAAARTALDAVRSNRYSDFVSGGEVGSALKEAIALERRLELAFEGSRFTDLKRYGLACQRSDFGHFADGSGLPAVFKQLAASDYHWQLPIPIGEINLNPNMVQNPGYDSN